MHKIGVEIDKKHQMTGRRKKKAAQRHLMTLGRFAGIIPEKIIFVL